MILTDEQIQKAIDRKESFALTDKEIEKLWYEASLKKNIDLVQIRVAYFTSIMDAMIIKAFKIDKKKAYKIIEVNDYLHSTLQVHRINNLQAELINSLNLQLFEQARNYREMEKEIKSLKENIK